ncbi:SNF2 helicase associated domain-containing protein [Bacillus manliponensis]|uniref:DEAD/DEAH box helicase n=1 Tax=Bacillus manliponensis TaxID=574376 RepID=UPI003517BF40
MDGYINVSKKMIKELCGETSYKKGEAYVRANKVTIESNGDAPVCEAVVEGDEAFHVTIENGKHDDIVAKCSCPSLASIQLYCQHIAAVLLHIDDTKGKGYVLSDNEMFDLFGDKPLKPKSKQHRFDTRKVLHVECICLPVTFENGSELFGVQLKLNRRHNVHDVREFLNQVEKRESFTCEDGFMYDPVVHSFEHETDAILQLLIQVYRNEKVYLHPLHRYEDMIFIPPSSWETLLSLLITIPFVTVQYNEKTIQGLELSRDLLPVYYQFYKETNGGYTLQIDGLQNVQVMESYGYVFSEGKLYEIDVDDCKRLIELKKMMNGSNVNQFHIPAERAAYFVEKVLPSLMKVGYVQVADNVTERLEKPVLKAKLFLDRVKDRLLAGLEFHYGNVVINPLEETRENSFFLRDEEKEAEILQVMDESAFTKTEGGYYLHNEEAEYNFLYHVVPTLHKLLHIYATTVVKLRIAPRDVAPLIRVKRGERIDWLAYRFDIKGIPEAQIKGVLKALEEKRKYYRLGNGSLLSLESREFQEINRFIKEANARHDVLYSDREIRVPLIQSMKWLRSFEEGNMLHLDDTVTELLESIRNPSVLGFEVPACVKNVLRPYQVDGFQWMKMLAHYRFGGILGDDMGVGKTLQSITFIASILSEIRERKVPVLIIAPSSLTYNWLHELKKFTPHIKARIIDGNQLERRKLVRHASEVDVVITSYPLLRRDMRLYEAEVFHTVFFDEAQAFKNSTTQTAKAVKSLRADHRFALTGTPVENSLEELWSIFYVIFPELLPEKREFMDLQREQIAKRVKPFILRRLKEDVLQELPDKIEHLQTSQLLPEQKKLYAAYLAKLKHDTLKHLDKDTLRKNKIRILAGITRLRQLCCHPALFVDDYKGSSAKFEQLLDIIEECRSTGRRILIFSQFTKMLSIIGRELIRKGMPYFYLDGNTPSEERVELCNRFNEGEGNLFLISLKAGGTGLNLTGADTVILYDVWWNPAVEQQAADRAYRMGQKNTVQVIKMIAHGTIEEKMNELQEKKKDLIAEVIEPGKEGVSAITEDEIREILMI